MGSSAVWKTKAGEAKTKKRSHNGKKKTISDKRLGEVTIETYRCWHERSGQQENVVCDGIHALARRILSSCSIFRDAPVFAVGEGRFKKEDEGGREKLAESTRS